MHFAYPAKWRYIKVLKKSAMCGYTIKATRTSSAPVNWSLVKHICMDQKLTLSTDILSHLETCEAILADGSVLLHSLFI